MFEPSEIMRSADVAFRSILAVAVGYTPTNPLTIWRRRV